MKNNVAPDERRTNLLITSLFCIFVAVVLCLVIILLTGCYDPRTYNVNIWQIAIAPTDEEKAATNSRDMPVIVPDNEKLDVDIDKLKPGTYKIWSIKSGTWNYVSLGVEATAPKTWTTDASVPITVTPLP